MIVCFKDKTKLLLLLLLIGSITPSCHKNENTVGDDFVGALVGFDVKSIDTTQIIAYTSIDDSVLTRYTSYYLMGSMNDPDFGTAHSSIITQYMPPTLSSGWDNSSIHIDSIVLQLRYVGPTFKYGNLNSTQTIRVYELAEDINADSSYRSDRNYQYDATKPIGTWQGVFNLEDSIRYTYAGQAVSLAPHLRIKLDAPEYINKFTSANSAVFASTGAFQAYFKGLVIAPDWSPTPGQGGIAHIDLKTDSYLRNMITSVVVYYDSVQKVEFPIYPDDNIKYNKFSHEHTGTIPIQPRMGGVHSDVNYVKSMAGLKTRILLPNIFDYTKQQNIAINGAEMIIPLVQGSTSDMYSAPVSIRLFASDSLGRNQIITDAFSGLDYYGGVYNSSSKQYSFNIIRHVQNLLTQYKQHGLNYNYGLNLFIQADNPVSASRAIIDTRPGKIKLKLSYTVIK